MSESVRDLLKLELEMYFSAFDFIPPDRSQPLLENIMAVLDDFFHNWKLDRMIDGLRAALKAEKYLSEAQTQWVAARIMVSTSNAVIAQVEDYRETVN